MTVEEIIDTLNGIETDAIYSLLDIEVKAIDEALEILEKVRDGRMIELPCKVGDTVYVLRNKNERKNNGLFKNYKLFDRTKKVLRVC